MSNTNGKIHAAVLENSPRLQRVLTYLRAMGPRGATTMEIVIGARVAVAGTAVSELRSNGISVDCKMETEKGGRTRIYRYTLAEFS